jgi:DNA-binding SARP family transcriptional activator
MADGRIVASCSRDDPGVVVPELRVELLGGFRVSVDGQTVDTSAWRRRKPAALMKLLALAPQHHLHRGQLVDLLWPDLDEASGGANLRKAVHQARRALAQVGRPAVIAADADHIWLDGDTVVVDVEEFRAAVVAARRVSDVDLFQRAVELYRDDLLPEDRYEDWAAAPTDTLRVEFLAVLEEYAGLLESRGEIGKAIEIVRRLVEIEPLREENHVRLIRLSALAGRRSEALRVYERLRTTLITELGTEPGPEAQRLFEEIRSRSALDPELAADVWERVGDLRVLSGDAEGAARAFATVLSNDNSPEVRARVERKCADAWLTRHRPAEAAAHLAVAVALSHDPAERARVLRTQANQAWETGDVSAAQAYAEQARALALEHGTPDDLAAAQEALAIVSHVKGEWREGLASELDRLAAGDGGTPQLARVFDIHHCIGQYHLYGDGLADSVEGYARRILDQAEEAGAVRAQAFAWCLLGESLLLQARWDESAGCLEQSCELHASLGSRSGALAWQRRAELSVCCGMQEQTEPYLRHASAIATVSAMASHMWGRIYATRAFAAVETGDPQRATEAVRAAAAAAQRYGDCPTCSALLNPIAAEAFAMLDDPESARVYAEAAERVGRMFASSAWQAMAMSAAGSAAIAEHDWVTAAASFDAAADLFTRAGQPYWATRVVRRNAQGTPAS